MRFRSSRTRPSPHLNRAIHRKALTTNFLKSIKILFYLELNIAIATTDR